VAATRAAAAVCFDVFPELPWLVPVVASLVAMVTAVMAMVAVATAMPELMVTGSVSVSTRRVAAW
jgi:hypothetical protein